MAKNQPSEATNDNDNDNSGGSSASTRLDRSKNALQTGLDGLTAALADDPSRSIVVRLQRAYNAGLEADKCRAVLDVVQGALDEARSAVEAVLARPPAERKRQKRDLPSRLEL